MAPLSKFQHFSPELHRIRTALEMVYAIDPPTPNIHLFTDSSAAIKAIASSGKPTNRCTSEIRNLLSCLKSSGSSITIYWIPSHSGIAGNEQADKLASAETCCPTGNTIKNELSPSEQISVLKSAWSKLVLQNLQNPSCRQRCAAIESIHQVLIECPALHSHRQKIVWFFDSSNLHLNTHRPKSRYRHQNPI